MELCEDAKFQLISGVPESASFYGIEVFVKSKFVLKSDSLLIANKHAIHGHMWYGTNSKKSKVRTLRR